MRSDEVLNPLGIEKQMKHIGLSGMPEYRFATAMMQYAATYRTTATCPHCGEWLAWGKGRLIYRGRLGVCCTFCEGER